MSSVGDFAMDLLENAVESIKAGVEDYEQGGHGRLLAAVRGIHAGILLLYKEALRRLSPADSDEVLIKAKILPKRDAQGQISFIGDGKKTVDVQQIKERFAGLNIATDWTRFDRITNVRNEVEHYYTKTSKKALQGLIADAFVVTRDFLATRLQEDPLKLLGDETWQTMLEVADVHAAERAECVAALKAFPWDSGVVEEGVLEITCGACSSDLIRPASTETAFNYDMILECRACGQTTTAESFVPEAVKSVLAGAMYVSHTNGDETPYTTCPECAAEAYIMEDECCALCGESAEHTCARCGCSIPASELGSSLCGYCNHMMSKDD
jgi:hypothetical protein